jgi:ABC-2 type transport system permease protein
MKNIWTIARRELKAYFVSPVAYATSAFFLAVMGLLFALILTSGGEASMRAIFSNLTFVVLMVAPALTMRLLAEEQQTGTIELLLTAPVHDWQVVLGKFLGSLILFVAMFLAPTLYYVLVLNVVGSPDLGPIATGYLALLLLGGSFISIGVFTSSLTRNQVVAYIAGLAILLILWLADATGTFAGSGPLSNVLSYLSITRHYDNMIGGVVDTQDIVYPLSMMAVSLFLATQVLQIRRWR